MIAQDAVAALHGGRQFGVESESLQPSADLEIWIDRQRVYLGSADEAIARIVTDLDVLNYVDGRTRSRLYALAIEKTQVVIVARDRAERVIPHDLDREFWVIGVE